VVVHGGSLQLITMFFEISNPGTNKNLYNGGSEWQNDYSNLPDYYQTFYRNYDAATARFISADPEPETAETMTPYQYAGNNPVMFNDPAGNTIYGVHPYPVPIAGYGGYWENVPHQTETSEPSQEEMDYNQQQNGLAGTDPDLAFQLGIEGGTTVYNVGNGTSANPQTGSQAIAMAAINAAATNTAIDFYINNGGVVTTMLHDGPGGIIVSVQDQNGVWRDAANQGGGITVPYNYGGLENTAQAFSLYLRGNGAPALLGNNVFDDLIKSKTFQSKNNKIISGKTSRLQGNFSVDLTSKDFFVGRTNVNYSISVVGGIATVTYTLFVNDGFWDVDFLDEGLAKSGNKFTPDGMGPNLERFGGHPYPFVPVTATETFPNPGY
jgi:RHS repeat-associated protein